MKHVVKYALEMHAPTVVREQTVTQNDAIEFVFTLLKGGEPIDMTGVTPSLAVKRRDGVTTALPGTASGNTVTFALGSTETAKPGPVYAAVQLYGADGRVSSLPFSFQVKGDLTAAGTIPSEKEATLIEVVLQDGPSIIQRAETAAADAERVAVENKTNWLDAVATVAERDTAYPSPKHGDTVRVTGTATVYRFETSKGWIVTDQYQQSAVDALNQQLADKAGRTEVNQLATKKADKVEVQEFKDLTGANFAVMVARYNQDPLPEPTLIENLWDINNTVLGTLSETSGNVSTHATNRTLNFTAVKPDTPYTFGAGASGAYKVVFYDGAKAFIEGYGWNNASTPITRNTPVNAAYVRVTADSATQNSFIINIGTELATEETIGSPYDEGFWEGVPSPPLREKSVKTHHIEDGSVTADKVPDGGITPNKTSFFHTSSNEFDVSKVVFNKTVETDGTIVDDARWLSDYIPVGHGNDVLSVTPSSYRIAAYGAEKNFLYRTGITNAGLISLSLPSNTSVRFIRLSSTVDPYSVMLNRGPVLQEFEEFGMVQLNRQFLPEIDSLIEHREQPFPKRLKFEEIMVGNDEVNHLSQDGEVLYFKRGAAVYQSADEGETLVRVGAPSPELTSVQAIRDLMDGELLVSTTRDESIGLKSKVYKSVGYDRNNPENTQFVEVLEAISSQANIYGSWGLEAHDNICLASEYGLRGDNGARHVYLSLDYGDTWRMIFDQKTTTQSIPGAPAWTTTAHLHTVHFDRYFERIWLVTGDSPNTATYYSDDFGNSWTFVEGSGTVQYTGIVSFPDGVVFGSDRAPNGLHVWKRTAAKSDKVVIRTMRTINNSEVITHVFQRAFRRYAEKGEVALFPATRIIDYQGTYSSVIMGLTNAHSQALLYDADIPSSLGFYVAVGVTAGGNIFTSYHNGTNNVVMRAKAPLWE